MKRIIAVCICFALLWLPVSVSAQDSYRIVAGSFLGPVNVGMNVDTLMDAMGIPSWAEKNESLNVMDIGYDEKGMIVALTQEGNVFFATTYSPQYSDEHGIKVGTSVEMIEKHYGKNVKKVASSNDIIVLLYKEHGIAFMIKGNSIVSIGIFSKGSQEGASI